MPHPLDEYPIHQAPASIRYPATTDRNFYDRSYFNAHDRTGEIFLITGLGVYPQLGIVDAYASVGRGSSVVSVHASDALHDNRLDQHVGPYRIEVIDPLHSLRLVCDATDYGVGFDLTWEGSFAAIEEPRHVHRIGDAQILDACRFAQVGTWSGELRVEGTKIEVTPDRWVGTRDRSWGIRPVGEQTPVARWAAEGATSGFWWLYVPLRFDDFAVIIILQESPDGIRTLNEAKRVWADGHVEELGWPEIEFTYRPGTRHPEGATIRTSRGPTIEVTTLYGIPLGPGTGYSGAEWTHGQWRGREWLEGVKHDWADPALAPGLPFVLVDHVARAMCDGQEGWGLFEHASIGRHDPTGFADFTSVAP